jgi:uncharacterized membrane protein YhaH (DUF805 family)
MLFSLETYKGLSGRVGRQTWWLGQLLLGLLLMVPYFIGVAVIAMTTDTAAAEPQPSSIGMMIGGVLIVVAAIAALWGTLALYIKRWHDRGKSGWWTLLAFIPIANIWALIECGFLRGTEGDNAYGPDPLA